MRLTLCLALLFTTFAGCSSRSQGGLSAGHRIQKSERLLLIPIADSQRERLRVFGTGPKVTAVIVHAFETRGYTVVVAPSADNAAVEKAIEENKSTLLVTGDFREYAPDMVLILQATRVNSDEVYSFANRTIGSPSIENDVRLGRIPELGEDAVEILVNPPAPFENIGKGNSGSK